jgi:hypothetical protein
VLALGAPVQTHSPKKRELLVGIAFLPLAISVACVFSFWSGGPSLTFAVGVGAVIFVIGSLTLLAYLNPPPVIVVHEHGLLVSRRGGATAMAWTEIERARSTTLSNGAEIIVLQSPNGFRALIATSHYEGAAALVATINAHVEIKRSAKKA